MVIYIYHFLLFKRSLPRVDVEQTSLKGKVEEMIKITKRFLKECSVLDGESPDFSLWDSALTVQHLCPGYSCIPFRDRRENAASGHCARWHSLGVQTRDAAEPKGKGWVLCG